MINSAVKVFVVLFLLAVICASMFGWTADFAGVAQKGYRKVAWVSDLGATVAGAVGKVVGFFSDDHTYVTDATVTQCYQAYYDNPPNVQITLLADTDAWYKIRWYRLIKIGDYVYSDRMYTQIGMTQWYYEHGGHCRMVSFGRWIAANNVVYIGTYVDYISDPDAYADWWDRDADKYLYVDVD